MADVLTDAKDGDEGTVSSPDAAANGVKGADAKADTDADADAAPPVVQDERRSVEVDRREELTEEPASYVDRVKSEFRLL